jgi:photosystem II stability/assembly factor-like uncharacterized protein
MKTISIPLFLLISLASCMKDKAPTLSEAASFPFENNHLKLEVVQQGAPFSAWDMHFFNESTGVVITLDGNIYKTNDGGITWITKYSKELDLLQILFTDDLTGYVVGGCKEGCPDTKGLILKTIDAGESWEPLFESNQAVEIDDIAVNSRGDLFILKNGYGWVASKKCEIMKSTDGGINWITVHTVNYELSKIIFSGTTGFCTGGFGSEDGKIVRSTDDGLSWDHNTTIDGLWTTDIAFSSNIGYCLSDNLSLYQTTNNGDTWSEVFTSGYSSYAIDAIDATTCILWGAGQYSGGDWGYFYGAVRQSIDAGSTWSNDEFKDIGAIRCSAFYSSSNGYFFSGGYGGPKLVKVTVK